MPRKPNRDTNKTTLEFTPECKELLIDLSEEEDKTMAKIIYSSLVDHKILRAALDNDYKRGLAVLRERPTRELRELSLALTSLKEWVDQVKNEREEKRLQHKSVKK